MYNKLSINMKSNKVDYSDLGLSNNYKDAIKSNMGHRSIARTILPYSGIYIDISSFLNSEMLEIRRRDANVDIVDQIENELLSIWKRTVSTSLHKELDFEEWLKAIKFPDLMCLYYGVYNSNYPGINSYNVECDNPKCNNIISVTRDNYDVSYINDNSKVDINSKVIDMIDRGIGRELNPLYNIASKIYELPILPFSSFKIYQSMPSLYDMMIFIKFLKLDLKESNEIIKKVIYPISWMGYSNTKRHIKNIVIAHKYNLYIKKLLVPVELKGVTSYVDVMSDLIYRIVNNMNTLDFKYIINNYNFKDIMVKDGISFRISDIFCNKCKTKQIPVTLDMRDIVFYSGEDREKDYTTGYITDDMREGNTDVKYSFTSMLDSVGELFNGRLSLDEIMNMDMPFMRSLVRSRLDNLKKRKSSTSNSGDFEKLLREFGS